MKRLLVFFRSRARYRAAEGESDFFLSLFLVSLSFALSFEKIEILED